jgi:hypothetical protein
MGLTITILFTIFAAVGIRHVWLAPGIPLLVSEGGAQWVRLPEASRLPIRWSEPSTTHFRYRLDVEKAPEQALLTLRAMKQAAVYLDGFFLFRSPMDGQGWKKAHVIDLAPRLVSGAHELRIDVINENGHPALLTYCPALKIQTDGSWEASRDGEYWLSALPVDEIPHLPLSRTFLRADRALWDSLPVFMPIFLFVFLWVYTVERLPINRLTKIQPSASGVRYLLLIGWFAMAVNNFWKLPLAVGMDNTGHWLYIQYIAKSWRIPLAKEGWQMFQPPLFHFLEAIVYKLFIPVFSTETVIRILKLLPLLCGALQAEICYRAMRYAYPQRESLQVIGTLLGGLLPMNLYISQSLGNEPLAGLLTAMVILCTIRMIAGDFLPTCKNKILIGFLLGLALLTKITVVLIIPPVLLVAAYIGFWKSNSMMEGAWLWIRFAAVVLGVAFVLCGWYYLRNYFEMGRFFIGGWDSLRQINWWQDPGYRTPRQLYGFGPALFYPVFSSLHGFWDAIYSSFWMDGFLSAYIRPPWNYGLMLSGAWLSLLPTMALIVGGAFAVFSRDGGPQRRMLRFTLSCVLLYLAAIFYIFLTVPILSSAKASYALGLIPCFALLAAKGFEILTRQRILRAVVHGLLACWVVGAYGAYFVM